MAQLETDSTTGPASYTTGGVTITTTLSTVDFANIEVSVPGANLPPCHFEIVRNSPAAGQFKYKIMVHKYDDVTSIDSVTGLPAGVSSRATSGGTYDNESSHLHTINHDHAAATSGANGAATGGTTLDLTSPINIGSHTHQFDPPNFTGNSGAGSAHTHAWDNLYSHIHTTTNTSTDISATELTNGTDLSGATFLYKAIKL